MQHIYVTEPDMIPIDQLRELLPADQFEIRSGQSDFISVEEPDVKAIVIRSLTTVTSDIKQHFPNLKAVVRVGTGLDNVDVEYCKANDVAVYNAPGANADAVAEYVTAMVLYVRRHLHMLNYENVAAWDRGLFSGTSVSEQTVGILGFGNIGKLLKQKLQALGATKFFVYDPYLTEEQVSSHGAELVDLDTILSSCDIISLHLPLTDETRHMISTEKLLLLKDHALLINASRGGVVDEAAMLALDPERDIYYVADTVEGEPEVNPALLTNQRVVVTPHIGSLTSASEAAMLRRAVENFLAG